MNVPSSAEMMDWIETICARGIRRPGYPADTETTKWAADLFADFGLSDVHLEPVVLPKWEPHEWSLSVDGTEFDCFPVPNSSPGTIDASLAIDDVNGSLARHCFSHTLLAIDGSRPRDPALRPKR